MVGPAILPALNLVRYQHPDDPWAFGHATEEPAEVGELEREELMKLAKNAIVVNTLQDIYSSRHKNRRCESSTLTSTESLRFTRALYRIMLFQRVFPGKTTIYIDDADTEQEREIRAARKAFFAMYTTAELREIYAVNNFIEALGTWLVRKVLNQDYARCDHAIVVPAEVFLHAYQERNPRLINRHFAHETFAGANNLLVGYVTDPVQAVWKERGEVSLSDSFNHILDHIEEQDDICKQCGTKAGIELWSASNWATQNATSLAFLPCILETLHMAGELPHNAWERAVLQAHMRRGVSLEDLLAELFALKRLPAFSSWRPEDAICLNCLKRFVTQHLHLWLLERKREAGQFIGPDCWYGYHCRVHLIHHDEEHARSFNHLCQARGYWDDGS
ncbi:hypothetical protein R3P38DRAFT_2860885 [Favolaschia claudopus]|uniref:Aprataxin and PNK-like factor PBZ domain-containing protein n=1 Tax=Favolaschia claudopus TaxID=2862362 RepID=A0AAW0DMZ2_9AGAR